MKLTCDLCNGELQMTTGGQSAVCSNCGITYPIERLREKLGAQNTPIVDARSADLSTTPTVIAPTQDSVACASSGEQPRNLIIRRKIDLFLSTIIAIIDGEQQYVLKGQGKESIIPLSTGHHTVEIIVRHISGNTSLGVLDFVINNHDWCGEVGLIRGAFKTKEEFKMWELV